MDKLSTEDYRRVLAAVEVLASAEDRDSFPVRALAAVAQAIDVDFASYGEVDLVAGWNRFLIYPDPEGRNTGSPEFAKFVRRFGHHPILARRLTAQASLDPSLDAFVSRLRLMGMVGNCCGEAGLNLTLDLTVRNANRRMLGISVHRGIREFDGHDAAVLGALRPHLKSALRIATRLAQAGSPAASATVTGVVDGLPLTARQSQVLYWVAMGKTNDEVGTIIGARPLTVKKHLENIYEKLGVPNRTAAARLYRTAAG